LEYHAEYDSSFAGVLQSDSRFSGKISPGFSVPLWALLIFSAAAGRAFVGFAVDRAAESV
jgi:hypothetical protein